MRAENVFTGARFLVAILKGACMAPKQINPITHYKEYQQWQYWLEASAWAVLAGGISYCKYTQTRKPNPIHTARTDTHYTEIPDDLTENKKSCRRNKAWFSLTLGLLYTAWEYYRFADTLVSATEKISSNNKGQTLRWLGILLLLSTSLENIQLAIFSTRQHDRNFINNHAILKSTAHFPMKWIKPFSTLMRVIMTRISVSCLTLDTDANLQFGHINAGAIIKTVAFWGVIDFYARASNNSYGNSSNDDQTQIRQYRGSGLIASMCVLFYAINDSAQYTDFFGQIPWYLPLFSTMTALTLVAYYPKTQQSVNATMAMIKSNCCLAKEGPTDHLTSPATSYTVQVIRPQDAVSRVRAQTM